MRLTQLHIGEFGIFRNQQMDEISPDIVLVAGPNRAGKTTLMQLLRFLAYPFPKTGEIPPQVGGYRVEADFITESGEKLILYRDGLSEPRLVSGAGQNEVDIGEHYMDGFTYRQLFTLSLDELQKIPGGVSNRQMRQLQSILLGAGLADLALLPEVIKNFENTSHGIGGKLGTPSVGEFKPYFEQITEGISQRNEANKQVDEYHRATEALTETDQRLNELQDLITQTELEKDRYEVLKSSYSLYNQYIRLTRKLEETENQELLESFPESKLRRAEEYLEQYPGILDELREQRNNFTREVPEENWEEQYQWVLQQKKQLQQWERNISGLRQRVNEYSELRDKQKHRYTELRERITSLRSGWSEDLTILDEIEMDELKSGELRELVSRYEQIENRKRTTEDEIADLESQREAKASVLSPETELRFSRNIRIFSGIALAAIIAGVLLVLYQDPLIGGLTGGGVTLIALTLLIIQYFQKSEARTRHQAAEQAIQELETKRNSLASRLEGLQRDLQHLDQSLEKYRKEIRLPETTPPNTVENFYFELRSVKDSYDEWKSGRENLSGKQKSIEEELEALAQVLREDLSEQSKSDPVQTFRSLNSSLDAQLTHLDRALNLSGVRDKKDQMESDIQKLLTEKSGQLSLEESLSTPEKIVEALRNFVNLGRQYAELIQEKQERDNARKTLIMTYSDRVGKAFGFDEKPSDAEYIDLLDKEYEQILSEDDVHKKFQQAENRLETLNSEREDTRKKHTELKSLLDNLSTSEKLEQAQARIDSARSGLEPLAREYAVNKLAAYLLKKVRDDYLESTQGELLEKASSYFRRLTSDAYSTILPPEGLENADFIAQKAGSEDQSVDILSRGTREQLFFAVRLSRIMELKPLPVIFDDSFVNFDVQHRRQAAQIVGELAGRNQVFVLTCHPEIIDYIAGQNAAVQYWLLNDGRIENSDYKTVQKAMNR